MGVVVIVVAVDIDGCDDADVGVNEIRFIFPFGVKLGKSFSCDTFATIIGVVVVVAAVGERSDELSDFRAFCECCFDVSGVKKSPKQMLDVFALRLSLDFSCDCFMQTADVSRQVLLSSNEYLESLDDCCRELYDVVVLRLWLFPLRLL